MCSDNDGFLWREDKVMVGPRRQQTEVMMSRIGAACAALLIVSFVAAAVWIAAFRVFPGFGLAIPYAAEELLRPAAIGILLLIVPLYRALRKPRMFGEVCWTAAVPIGMALTAFAFWGLIEARASLGLRSRAAIAAESSAVPQEPARSQESVLPSSNTKLATTAYVLAVFLDNGWFQPATVSVFCIAATVLLLKARRSGWERRATRTTIGRLLNWPSGPFTVNDAAGLLQGIKANRQIQRVRQTALVRRVERILERIDNTKSTAGMDELLNSLSGIDADSSQASFGGVSFLVYLMPAIGFLGTVYGVGQAIYGFSVVIPQAQDFGSIVPQLTAITCRLGTAFDTTLLALVLSAVAGLGSTVVRHAEDVTLGRVDADCVELFRSLTHEDPGTKEIVAAIQGLGGEGFRKALQNNMAILDQSVGNLNSQVASVRQEFASLDGQLKACAQMLQSLAASLDRGSARFASETQKLCDMTAREVNRLVSELTSAVEKASRQVDDGAGRIEKRIIATAEQLVDQLGNGVRNVPSQVGQLIDRMGDATNAFQEASKSFDAVRRHLDALNGPLAELGQLGKIREALKDITDRGVSVTLRRAVAESDSRLDAQTGYAVLRWSKLKEWLRKVWRMVGLR